MDDASAFYTVTELRERLSISTLVFWQYRPVGRGALEELARCGIRRIELLESPEQFDLTDPGSMRLIGEGCRACGIEIVAYHAHKTNFSGLDTEAERCARVDHCRRQIDTMLELGGALWGPHAGAADAATVKCFADLARHVEHTPVRIGIENFGGPGTEVEDRAALIDELGHPQVGMILDIGHVRDERGANPMTIPGGPTRALETCGDRLIHVHLHGFKDGVDHFPPFVEGDGIRWVELFRMLRAIGYPGYINFEPSGEPRCQGALEATASVPERIVEMAG